MHPQTEKNVENFHSKFFRVKHFAEKEKSNLHFNNFSISPKIKRQPEAYLKDLKKSNFEEKFA